MKKTKKGRKIAWLNIMLFKKFHKTIVKSFKIMVYCVIYIVFCLRVLLMLVKWIFQHLKTEIFKKKKGILTNQP